MTPIQLRSQLTPFATGLPLQPGQRVITAVAAVEAMRAVLVRHGLQTAQALRQGDGSLRPTWYEAPEVWIASRSGSESAIVLTEDAAGPLAIEFLTRTAEGVKTT